MSSSGSMVGLSFLELVCIVSSRRVSVTSAGPGLTTANWRRGATAVGGRQNCDWVRVGIYRRGMRRVRGNASPILLFGGKGRDRATSQRRA